MSLNLSTVTYGLNKDIFSYVLSFLDPKDLARAERICKSWKVFIEATDQWKWQCQNLLNLPSHINPVPYMPEGMTYKEAARRIRIPKIIDDKIYGIYLGAGIGPVRSIPQAYLTSAAKTNPCDPTQTNGQSCTLMYNPPYFKVINRGHFPYVLDKPDDGCSEEASQLIPGESEIGTEITVPNTINNSEKLFQHPKQGTPSKFSCIWKNIKEQHGNKRITPGWICIRDEVIEKGERFAVQKKNAEDKGLVIPSLHERINFNLLIHTISGKYPDGNDPWAYARTSTSVQDESVVWPAGCGDGGPSGLRVFSRIGSCRVGLAVALPSEVQAIGH